MDKIFYMCPNSECLNMDFDENVQDFWVPLYKEGYLNDEYNVSRLIDLFSNYGERCYYSINPYDLKDKLVRVTEVNTDIIDNRLIIQFGFEDGKIYEPNRDFFIDEESFGDDGLCSIERVTEL